ncbi:maleylpyruvate isomerase N-terminal domain-containing protein [Nocardiopsis sediminis]|uniref:Maleylpyruvate isomerase N-terminal domain-containing protein n=1 Tax=Nocardiopsis sediminis TaxID=1778267 RepID=A0ABV8FM27_9ACTN
MPTTPVTAFTEVIDTIGHLVEAVEDGQWSAPTPCTDWNVRQLVDHLMTAQRTFTVVMGAEPSLPALDADPAPEGAPAIDRLAALLGRDATE